MTFSSDGCSLTSHASGKTQRWVLNSDVVKESSDRVGIELSTVAVETEGNWLLVNKRRTLWIPLEYRGGAVRARVKGERVTVCIGCNTGSVVYVCTLVEYSFVNKNIRRYSNSVYNTKQKVRRMGGHMNNL